MPYCSSCGNQVHDRDLFCRQCGSRQTVHPPPPPPVADPLGSMKPRTVIMLCYIPVVGWIAAVVVLATQRFRRDIDVRFHAFQALYLFAAWLVVDWGIKPIFRAFGEGAFRVDELLQVVLFAAAIFMIVKTKRGESYRLPFLGDLAYRSATES